MTSATEPGPAEGTDGEGWAKTVVDGIAESAPARPGADDEPGGAEASPGVEGADGGDPGVEAPGADPADAPAGPATTGDPISVEDLVADLERVSSERDQYLDTSRRIQAEFENYKKQVAKREVEARERANDSLIGQLLPVLDAFDGALASGASDVAPMRTTFLDALAKEGLERIEPAESQFDPNLHEAVMHEDGDETDGPIVAEVMRAGYVWKGRVLRPAMVKTRG
jgi:molecular chaperone GrpE